jgi:hypothetical protein
MCMAYRPRRAELRHYSDILARGMGCIFSTPQCHAPRLVLTIRTRHNIAVSYMLKFPLSQKLFRLLA